MNPPPRGSLRPNLSGTFQQVNGIGLLWPP
jgi:hypothetical protein